MCGICGIYEHQTRQPVGEQILCAMTDSMRHRGPDGEGFYFADGDGVALGMRRLAIIDLTSGDQPIFNEDKSIVIVFNGEIYNYHELAERLRARGHMLATKSDTEVIVHLYEDMGDDCVRELRGIFGLAIWDTRRRHLLVARDHLGVKPIYYTTMGNRLIFASEIKAILQHPQVHAEMDLQALSNFLSLKYVPAPQTMFEDIYALPPGHFLAADAHGIRVQPYWHLSFANNRNGHLREQDYAEQLKALLQESVQMQLMSDVPFGAFLSGGVDSSTIVALMSQFLKEPVKTFSVGFEGDGAEESELPYARMVAQMYHTDHHEVMVRAQDFTDLAQKLIWHLDQPIADDAVLANYMVARLAAQHVKMVLTGEGGDELFAGYARYAGERFAPLFQQIPAPARHLALTASQRVPGMRGAKLALYALSQSDEVSRMTNWFTLFNPERKHALLSPAVQRELLTTSANPVFAEQLSRTDARDPLSRMLYVDTKLWLPDDLLARGDKTSMASSLEARVPLLDPRLVEFAATLPPNLKVHGLARKYLLKQVAREWLPREIIDRKKKGFPIPLGAWFRHEARPFVRDILSPEAIRRRGLFNADYVDRLLNEHESGFAEHSSLIWGLIGVELWQRAYTDKG